VRGFVKGLVPTAGIGAIGATVDVVEAFGSVVVVLFVVVIAAAAVVVDVVVTVVFIAVSLVVEIFGVVDGSIEDIPFTFRLVALMVLFLLELIFIVVLVLFVLVAVFILVFVEFIADKEDCKLVVFNEEVFNELELFVVVANVSVVILESTVLTYLLVSFTKFEIKVLPKLPVSIIEL